MGLTIELGVLADFLMHDEEGAEWLTQAFDLANQLLEDGGNPTFIEPTRLGPLQDRTGVVGMPYSELHFVRRAYAFASQNPGQLLPPLPPGASPHNDPDLQRFDGDFFCHLVNHSDCEGFYLPVDFGEILFHDDLPGGIVGSSYRLRYELAIAAGALGIVLVDGVLSDAEADRINLANEQSFQAGGHMSWLAHWEAARLSIEHGSAIVYT